MKQGMKIHDKTNLNSLELVIDLSIKQKILG